ncbi:Tyrosine-sulfated glycopeptide receptor 1 [Linum grandiflorum]
MELLKATDNFSQANIVGCGGFGLVYKATLANGTKLAVKKLSGDFGLMEREFKSEIEALSTAQHENLVSLQGYCVHNGFRLLIYSYMENEKTEGASQLDWPTRLNIAKGASFGLAYMHQVCEPHIVHRDIKSSNILLDEKFEAHVADFGLARLIRPYCTHVTTELVGTLGYIPPEYGQAWIATLRGDVYSFGVVMLELLSGKRPVEVFKPKMSRELVAWVYQMRSEGKQEQIFDPVLRDKGYEDEMLQMLDVACMCVSHNPRKRPSIQEVVDCLKNIGSSSSPQKEQNND